MIEQFQHEVHVDSTRKFTQHFFNAFFYTCLTYLPQINYYLERDPNVMKYFIQMFGLLPIERDNLKFDNVSLGYLASEFYHFIKIHLNNLLQMKDYSEKQELIVNCLLRRLVEFRVPIKNNTWTKLSSLTTDKHLLINCLDLVTSLDEYLIVLQYVIKHNIINEPMKLQLINNFDRLINRTDFTRKYSSKKIRFNYFFSLFCSYLGKYSKFINISTTTISNQYLFIDREYQYISINH
jgi:hypothetical protein